MRRKFYFEGTLLLTKASASYILIFNILMEKRGGRYLAPTNGLQETNGKPITPEALKALPEELNRLAKWGQEAMVSGIGGITYPSRSRSKPARALRNSNHR